MLYVLQEPDLKAGIYNLTAKAVNDDDTGSDASPHTATYNLVTVTEPPTPEPSPSPDPPTDPPPTESTPADSPSPEPPSGRPAGVILLIILIIHCGLICITAPQSKANEYNCVLVNRLLYLCYCLYVPIFCDCLVFSCSGTSFTTAQIGIIAGVVVGVFVALVMVPCGIFSCFVLCQK